MNTFITTTELRTKTAGLVDLLLAGKEVNLIHRSKMIAIIQPHTQRVIKPLTAKDIKQLIKLVHSMNLPHTTVAQREKTYRKHLEVKYGKLVS